MKYCYANGGIPCDPLACVVREEGVCEAAKEARKVIADILMDAASYVPYEPVWSVLYDLACEWDPGVLPF